MTETPPPRRALATFLRRAPARDAGSDDASRPAGVAVDASAEPAEKATLETSAPSVPAEEAQPPETTVTPVDDGPAATVHAEALEDSESAPPEVDVAATEPSPAPVAAAAAWQAARLPIAHAAAPTFARPRARPARPRTSAWQWAAMVVLALLLALQILLADRARLATDAQWRPLLATLCSIARCELPPWHEPGAFTMLDRDVRPAQDQAGALRIQASFRNDARWSQDWPALQLSLSDADGRVIGSRVFSPTEYLGHPPVVGERLAPGQSARIDFRVREPAAGTAAFTFEFH